MSRPHVGVRQDVEVAVTAPIAGAFGDRHRGVVDHLDEAGWVALG
jgi:hypothetical protein